MLSVCQQSLSEFSSLHEEVKEHLGQAYIGIGSDWGALEKDLWLFSQALTSLGTAEKICLMDKDSYQNCRENFDQIEKKITEIIAQSKDARELLERCFDKDLYDIENAPIMESACKFKICQDKIDELENWYRFYNLYLKLKNKGLMEFIDKAIESNIPAEDFVDSYRRNFFRQWIDVILHSSETLAKANRISHDSQVKNFVCHDKQQFDISKAQIRSTLSKNRPSLDMMAPGSAVSILLREGEKKRKQKSVRA